MRALGAGRRGDERAGLGRRGDERGFALITVLAVIAVTALVFGALLGLMLLTIKITANHQKVERERRAADGAVVATLNHLRLGTPGAGCSEVPGDLPGFALEFDLPAASDTVEVTCRAGADEYGEPAGEVKLVGDRYSGEMADWRSAWPWAQGPGGALAALGVAGVEPSLIHTGPQPLRFNGHVNTITGAAALRDPTYGSPAIEVRGQYRQGAPGIGATGTDCGLLGEPGSPMFIDTVADRSCGDLSVLSGANPADYAIDQTVPNLPDPGADGCPGGPVVTFAPGRYDRHAVTTLNGWFDGSCPNLTFHFPSGRYWFDASDENMLAADRNALVLDDDTSSFVFGQAKDWSTAVGAAPSNFPYACDAGVTAAAPGGSIVLSGRTSLQHRGGRLAVCPYVSPEGQPYPAILQQRTVPTAITVSAGADKDFKPAANLVSGDPGNATDQVVMSCRIRVGENHCDSARSFEVRLSSPMSMDGSGPLSSAQLMITGNEQDFPVTVLQSRKVNATVVTAAGTSCSTGPTNALIHNGRRTTIDLLAGDCAPKLTDPHSLDGATVSVTLTYRYAGLCFDILKGSCSISGPQRLVIWDVAVIANAWVGSASTVGASDGWSNVARVLTDGGTQTASFNSICGERVCLGPHAELSVRHWFRLDDVSLTGPLEDSDHLSSIGIVIRQYGDQAQGVNTAIMGGVTALRLVLSDGSVCTREFEGVVNAQGSTYYPMLEERGSQCGEFTWAPDEQIAALLDGASITVDVTLDCLFPLAGKCGGELLKPAYVQPVPIQYVGLMATTNSYKGDVTRSAITVDSTDSGAGSSANFFGSAHMPHSSLDMYWNGAPSGASIFGGELQLSALGSRMLPDAEADVVCCTRPDKSAYEVRLTAHIAGRPVLSVVAALAPDRGMPEILEWTQCGRNGACGPPD